MNINKVSKVEYPMGRVIDSYSNSKASTSKGVITPKEAKFKNTSNTHINEVKSRSLKSKREVKTSGVNSSNTTKKCSSSGLKSNADTEKKTTQERIHDVAGQSERNQSDQTQSPKPQCTPSMKSHTPKTTTPKDPPIHDNQKTKVEKNEITKHPNRKKKEVSKDPPVASKKKEPRKREPKASAKRPIPKPNNPEASRRTETHVSSQAEKNNNHSHSPSRYGGPCSYSPIHHIRWEGNDKEVSGHMCSLCNKDLMCSPHDNDDDYGSYEDDRYGDEYEYEYESELTPQILLPSVDVFACGHAFHSECGRYIIPEEQSTDPPCVLCLSMA